MQLTLRRPVQQIISKSFATVLCQPLRFQQKCATDRLRAKLCDSSARKRSATIALKSCAPVKVGAQFCSPRNIPNATIWVWARASLGQTCPGRNASGGCLALPPHGVPIQCSHKPKLLWRAYATTTASRWVARRQRTARETPSETQYL